MKVWKVELLWEYSLAFYRNKSVQDCSIQLQDQFGFNVNLLLLCCYLNQRQYQLEKKDLEALQDGIKETEEKIHLQRQLRREAKGTAQYKQLLDIELTLEKSQQSALINTLNHQQIKPGSSNNLMTYQQQHKANRSKSAQVQLLEKLNQLANQFLSSKGFLIATGSNQ
jgi:uncharacterized protein (TIGR02444 family)